VAVQIALSVMLLTAAGLLVRSVRNLEHVSLGFDARNLLLFQVDPARNGYDEARQRQLSAIVLERLRALPGVTAASLSSHRLISNSSSYGATMRPDEVAPDRGSAEARSFGRTHGTYLLVVDEAFFSTMGIPLLRGRSFGTADVGNEPAVVVNRALALRLFGTDDVVGREIRTSMRREVPLHRIVGVCADARYASLRRPIEGTAYLFYRQQPPNKGATTFEVRTAGEPAAIVASVREILRAIDPTLPASRVGTQLEQIAASVEAERLFARLASLLGLTTLVLSAIGLYGLLAYSVVQRTPEIGIRMALGAAVGAVRWMVLRESLALVACGLLAGIPAAFAGTKMLTSLLFGLAPRDPATLAGAAAFMVVLALVAAYLPARRASRVDPLAALRAD
jgi:predicted permease